MFFQAWVSPRNQRNAIESISACSGTDLDILKTGFDVPCELKVSSTIIHMIHILWSIIVGFIAGLIARGIMHTHLGFIGTTLLGIAGSIVGGLIARIFSRPSEGSKFHPAGFIMSIVGAIVVLFLVRLMG